MSNFTLSLSQSMVWEIVSSEVADIDDSHIFFTDSEMEDARKRLVETLERHVDEVTPCRLHVGGYDLSVLHWALDRVGRQQADGGPWRRLCRDISHFRRYGKPRPPSAKASHDPELRAEAERVVHESVKEMVRVARRKANDLPLPKGWKPKVKISWLASRRNSHGGSVRGSELYGDGAISLALHRRVPSNGGGGPFKWGEYKHVDRNPTIGGFVSGDWRTVVKALVAHELAHAIQYTVWRHARHKGRHAKIDYKTAHGRGWQNIYALLRRECVNPLYKGEAAAGGEKAVETVRVEDRAEHEAGEKPKKVFWTVYATARTRRTCLGRVRAESKESAFQRACAKYRVPETKWDRLEIVRSTGDSPFRL